MAKYIFHYFEVDCFPYGQNRLSFNIKYVASTTTKIASTLILEKGCF